MLSLILYWILFEIIIKINHLKETSNPKWYRASPGTLEASHSTQAISGASSVSGRKYHINWIKASKNMQVGIKRNFWTHDTCSLMKATGVISHWMSLAREMFWEKDFQKFKRLWKSTTVSASVLYRRVQVLNMNSYFKYQECDFLTISCLSMSLSPNFPLRVKRSKNSLLIWLHDKQFCRNTNNNSSSTKNNNLKVKSCH